MFNSSLACLRLTFADKSQDTLPPSWVRTWSKYSPLDKIQYETSFVLPISGQPVSIVYGTVYEPGEHITEVNQSIQYVYVTDIANAKRVLSTGLVAPNSVIAAQPFGDSAFTVQLNNIGQLILGDGLYNGSLTLNGQSSQDTQILTSGHSSINGGLGGTATMYMALRGSTKYVIIYLNGFRTGATNQTMTLPVPFTSFVNMTTGDIGNSTVWAGFSLLLSGAAQTMHMLTTLSATGGGFSSVTTMYGLSFGSVRGGIDTIQFNSASANSVLGLIVLEGT